MRKRNKYNPASLHGDDLAELGLDAGTLVEIISAHGRIQQIVERDDTMRRGWYPRARDGAARPARKMSGGWQLFNALIDTDVHYEEINAMPHMTAVPGSFRPGGVA